MKIKKLKIRNIRSYKNLEIEFPVGATLLSGDIGSGKTSILLALQFALFGLQPGQKGNSILRQGEETAEVELEVEIGGKNIILKRSLKKSKAGSITQDTNIIEIDGKNEELSTSEMKNRVISLLDYPKEFAKKSDLLYKYTVYTPQEGMKEIINERPEIRLDLIRHIFGVDRYKRIKENAQIFLQKIKENVKIKEVQIKDINDLKEKAVTSNENKIKLSKETINLSIALERTNAEKKEIMDSLERLKVIVEEKNNLDVQKSRKEGELLAKKTLRIRLEKEIEQTKTQFKDKVDFSLEEMAKVSALVQKHKNLIEDLNSKYLEVNSKIYSFNAQKETAFSLKEKVVSLENCPSCFQKVGDEHKEKISKKTQFEIEDLQRELENKIIEKNQITRDLEKEKEILQGYEQDLLLLEKNKVKFEHQKLVEIKIKSDLIILERTNMEIKVLEEEVKVFEVKLAKLTDSKQVYDQEKNKYENIDFESRRTEINLAEKRKELELLKNRLEEITFEIATKEKIREELAHIRSLQDWLSEKFLPLISLTETNVMVTLRRDFSKVFNEWFAMLVSDTLSARLDEDFTPIIKNQDYEIDYDFLSGGERTAVALAYRLALNQVINSLLSRIKTKDLLILDEPTDGFSEQQLDKVRDIFDQLQCQQVILVSHEHQIEGFVDNVIKIKKDGTSKIESKATSHPE